MDDFSLLCVYHYLILYVTSGSLLSKKSDLFLFRNQMKKVKGRAEKIGTVGSPEPNNFIYFALHTKENHLFLTKKKHFLPKFQYT